MEINAVTAYLRQLSSAVSPGVGADSLHFATIVTPGVDPKQSEAMVAMMRSAFTSRNETQEAHSGRMRMPLDLIPRTLELGVVSLGVKGSTGNLGRPIRGKL